MRAATVRNGVKKRRSERGGAAVPEDSAPRGFHLTARLRCALLHALLKYVAELPHITQLAQPPVRGSSSIST